MSTGSTPNPELTGALKDLLKRFDCVTGTLHWLDADGQLALAAEVGMPPQLLPKVQRIPLGKGMAGLAAARREPVQICNLQSDASGQAKPAAKETRMEGSLAVPIIVAGELKGTLGIAKPVPYTFTDEETLAVMQAGQDLAKH